MLPPDVTEHLNAAGHEAVTPSTLGAHNLPDDELIQIATAERLVIVTESASDFAHVTTCAVLLVRKSWWPRATLAPDLAAALDRWVRAYPEPGPWALWLEAALRNSGP